MATRSSKDELRIFEEKYYPAIGRAIVAWAKLEIQVDEQLLAMLRHKNAAATRQLLGIRLIDQIPKAFRDRLTLCEDLAPIFYTGEPLSELLRITKASRREIKDRNKIAHGEWTIRFVSRKPPRVICHLRRHGAPGKERGFTVADISKKAATYARLSRDLTYFARDHHPDGPLPERLQRFFRSLTDSHRSSRSSATQAENP